MTHSQQRDVCHTGGSQSMWAFMSVLCLLKKEYQKKGENWNKISVVTLTWSLSESLNHRGSAPFPGPNPPKGDDCAWQAAGAQQVLAEWVTNALPSVTVALAGSGAHFSLRQQNQTMWEVEVESRWEKLSLGLWYCAQRGIPSSHLGINHPKLTLPSLKSYSPALFIHGRL